MNKNKKIFSLVSLTALVASLFFPLHSRAYSFPVPYGSVEIDKTQMLEMSQDIMKQTEDRYGFDQNILRNAKRKEYAPRVQIFFDKATPKAGEKVTAQAVPEYFKNDPQNLYYTWYIIHTEKGTPQSAKNSINEGKVEAAGIMAHGDYDPALDGQTYQNKSEDPDKDGWPTVDSNSFDAGTSQAPMGGSDGVGGLPAKTVEAFSSSSDWCNSLGDHSWDKCSFSDDNSQKPLNTFFTLKSSQTNHYCDLCKDYFSGDGLAAYTAAKSTRNSCCYNNMTNKDCVDGDGNPIKCPYDAATDYCGVTYNSLFDGCYESFKETNKSTAASCLDAQYSSCKSDWAAVHHDANGDGFSDSNEEATTTVSRCYRHNFGSSNNAAIFRNNELSGSTTEDPSGLDFPVACRHKWIDAPNYTSGSGKFTTGEEEYWKTDPTAPDTDGDGISDGAAVIGLGHETFTWTYQPGDRVGVAVEGTSMIPTDENNAYYKIMWGYPDICDSSKAGLMKNDQCEGPNDYGYGYLATIAPNEEVNGQQLKVSLSFTPDNPMADPSDENKDNIDTNGVISDADQISVSSSLDNSELNPKTLYYTWQISKSTSLSGDKWDEIKDIPGNFDISTATTGLGLTDLAFAPKKNILDADKETVVYFKVTLTVATASDIKQNRGRSSVIVPVNKNGIKIALYKVNAANGKASLGDEVCKDGLYGMLCPTVENQMLGAKVTSKKYDLSSSNFSWSIDGETYSVPTDSSQSLDGLDSRTIIFPITKSEGELQDVSVTATPKDQLAPVTGDRAITVVKPAAFIKPVDTNQSWPEIDTVQDPNNKDASVQTESTDSFQAVAGKDATYRLDFLPDYLLNNDTNTTINWSVNGTSISDVEFYASNLGINNVGQSPDGRQLTVTIPKEIGNFSNIKVDVKKYWSKDEQDILSSVWGLSPDTLSGDFSATIESVASAPFNASVIGMPENPGQILAAVGTHLPHYLMYNLRLALTILVMFFASAVFYGVSQKMTDYEKKE